MTFTTEFPDFPPEAMPAIPAGWKDQSWHNDACPCFNTGKGTLVYVDYADAETREFPDCERFTVIADPEVHNHNETLFSSDDWAAILAHVND